jgi:class 3 adenylate cyclase
MIGGRGADPPARDGHPVGDSPLPLRRKNLNRPDEVREFPRGRTEIFNLGDTLIGRQVFEAGWRWSTDNQPAVGTEWCEVFHQGLVISGRLRVAMSDGPELEVGPGDLFEVPPGHDAWVVGDEAYVSIDFAGRRYFAAPEASSGKQTVATVLFTDIVDSTQTAARLGDANWRSLIAEHNDRAKRQIDKFRGREVKTTGDGLLVVFDSAAAGVRAGAGIVEATAGLGIGLRVGVHSGEVELTTSDVRGIAVHTAARVMSAASAGEVLVSRTTHDLAAGSGLEFESRGAHRLKGLVEPVELFVLVRPSAEAAG